MGIFSWLRKKKQPEPTIISPHPLMHDYDVQREPGYKHTNSKGVTYYLNSKMVTLRGGKQQPIFYFSKDERPEGIQLPDGYTVRENPRNGFLTVSRPVDPSAKSCEDDDED